MKHFRRVALLCFSLSLCVSSNVLGQKSFALGLGGGAAIPVGKLSDSQTTGYNAIAVLAIGVAEMPIGVRFDGVYTDLTGVGSGNAPTSHLRVIGALANLIYAFPGTSAKPYVIVGAGLYNSKADTSGAQSLNNVGFNAGLGATFGFGSFATFLESRYHSISRNASKGGVYQFVPITIGFLF